MHASVTITAVLAVWFGVLSAVPHTHLIDRGDRSCEAWSRSTVDRLTGDLLAAAGAHDHPCLACLIRGTTAAPAGPALDLQPTATVGCAFAPADSIRGHGRAHLPGQRGPPISV